LIERHSGVKPEIIHNGIFYDEYQRVGNPNGSVLWPKTGINPTCNPDDFVWLSQQTKEKFTSFVNLPGVTKINTMSRRELKDFLKTCSILVAITKENDSVFIMEAMATGVPVLAYDWGMAHDRLEHKRGCYLVRPGDKDELLKGYLYLKENWKKQSEIAHTIAGYFDWSLQKPKLESVLQKTLKEKETPNRVSIIIPCHNYAKFVGSAIQSAKKQTVDCQIVVVNDGSNDGSAEEIRNNDPDIIITNKESLGVSMARNQGIQHASGNMIICLDADDMLEKTFVETVLKGFKKRKTAISFTPLRLIDEKNKDIGIKMFTQPPSAQMQKSGYNTVPSCCMFRKSWWERADGYDIYLSFTEDANLWMKMFQLGGEAVQASSTPLVLYRRHPNNNSRTPGSKWDIFHPDVNILDLSPVQIVLLIIGEEIPSKQAYWRLKNFQYPIAILTMNELSKYGLSKTPTNYLVLNPGPNIEQEAKDHLETWTQLFLSPLE
jgi:glycosyltransferase involved in cell wall biosynthesis